MRPWIAVAALLAAATGYGVRQARHRREQVDLLTGRIPAWHGYWNERGRVRDGAALLVALGDSAVLGVGASRPQRGFVGLLADRIGIGTGRQVRVRNLAIDGARVRTVIEEELHRMPADPDVVVLGVGGNDVWTFDPDRFAADLDELLTALPAHTIVGEVPSFAPLPVERRVRAMNRIVREVAARHGMPVAPVHAETGRVGLVSAVRNAAGDLFHPNDRGHARWARAYAPLVDARTRVLRDTRDHDPRPDAGPTAAARPCSGPNS